MRDQGIREALDEYAAKHLEETVDPWPAIRRAGTRPRPQPGKGRTSTGPRQRLLLPALLLVLVFGTAGGVGVSGMRWFSQWTPRSTLERLGQLHAIDQSQTVDGYTITLRHAYADANVILLETIVHDPAGQVTIRVRPTWQLTDTRGIVLPQAFDSGTIAVDPGVPGQYATFDAAAVRDTAPLLPLRLSLTLALDAPASVPATGTPEAAIGEQDAYALPMPMAAPLPARTISLAAAFAFAVPFLPGIALKPQQTVRVADFPLTLRQVVVTPAETRAIICSPAPVGTADDHWLVVADDDGRAVPSSEERAGLAAEDETAVRGAGRCGVLHLAGQERKAGTRQLRITEVSWGQTGGETRLAGPWIFRYTLP